MNNVDFDQKTLSHSSCSSQKRKEAEKKAALLLLQDENLMTRIFLQDRDISRQFNNNGLLIFQTNISPNSKLLLLLLLLHEKLHSAAFDRQWPPAKLTPTFFWCLAASPVHDLYCSLYFTAYEPQRKHVTNV